MLNLKLFLGFSTDSQFQHALKLANPHLVSLFIGKEEYLQEITLAEKHYLGKHLSSFPTLDQLEIFEKHLLSILQRLAPNYAFSNNPPVLMIVQ